VACRVLEVSRSGYYGWLSRSASPRHQENDLLLKHIEQIHADSRETYGSPRIHAELTLGLGLSVNLKRVARLMRQAGIQGSTGADAVAARFVTRTPHPAQTWSTGTSPSPSRTGCGSPTSPNTPPQKAPYIARR
jgi:transposase InsO family protein